MKTLAKIEVKNAYCELKKFLIFPKKAQTRAVSYFCRKNCFLAKSRVFAAPKFLIFRKKREFSKPYPQKVSLKKSSLKQNKNCIGTCFNHFAGLYTQS